MHPPVAIFLPSLEMQMQWMFPVCRFTLDLQSSPESESKMIMALPVTAKRKLLSGE